VSTVIKLVEVTRTFKLGIDAANLRSGGGVTHIVELLRNAEPIKMGFSQVVVWGGSKILTKLEDRSWLIKKEEIALSQGLFKRVIWQKTKLSRLARKEGCDVLLVPGGAYAGSFCPVAVMCRNMLPFEWNEIKRYGFSFMAIKWILLFFVQRRSFRVADGVIFLTSYAKSAVIKIAGLRLRTTATIPHGINDSFRLNLKPQESIASYSDIKKPYRILYVSQIDWYKHQWHVVEALANLRRKGFPLHLELVGSQFPPAFKRLMRAIEKYDPNCSFVNYKGALAYEDMIDCYANADMCLFGSSCENMPNTLLEAMASGLPIASSNRGPMPEVLQDGGVYFDPECAEQIESAVLRLLKSSQLRERVVFRATRLASEYTWKRCANETFKFLSKLASQKET
jgi:glycosyltransferase involved in cell wall biosynthesis